MFSLEERELVLLVQVNSQVHELVDLPLNADSFRLNVLHSNPG